MLVTHKVVASTPKTTSVVSFSLLQDGRTLVALERPTVLATRVSFFLDQSNLAFMYGAIHGYLTNGVRTFYSETVDLSIIPNGTAVLVGFDMYTPYRQKVTAYLSEVELVLIAKGILTYLKEGPGQGLDFPMEMQL